MKWFFAKCHNEIHPKKIQKTYNKTITIILKENIAQYSLKDAEKRNKIIIQKYVKR